MDASRNLHAVEGDATAVDAEVEPDPRDTFPKSKTDYVGGYRRRQ